MHGSRKICQRGSKLDNGFSLVHEERKAPNATVNRPSSASQCNAFQMAFYWRADGGTTLNAGLEAL